MQAKLSPHNQRELSKLIISIRANAHHLDLFLAVCDDHELRDLLIQQYEKTLANEGFTLDRVGINPKAPSLKVALDEFVKYNPGLQSNAVVTVLGSSSLFGVRLAEDKSEQEKFFFSLQWTREALREFKFPVVIWLSDPVATGISQQAPDFWSWRSGVFEFEAQPKGAEQAYSPMRPEDDTAFALEADDLTTLAHTISDLQQQIDGLQRQNSKSPLLTTLLTELGDAYSQQCAYESALNAYRQALEQAGNSKNQSKQAYIIFKLGDVLLNCRRYKQARTYYQQALDTDIETNNRNGQAMAYHQLGRVAQQLREYEQALAYYQQALDIMIETNNRNGQAMTYHQLGRVAQQLREYEQAQTYYQQALDISIEINNRNSQTATYHQLGMVAEELREYEQARTYYQQALDIAIETNNRNGQAMTYHQLGIVAEVLNDISAAKRFYLQDLQITVEVNDQAGLEVSCRNLARFYKEHPDDDWLANAAQLLNTSLDELKAMIAK